MGGGGHWLVATYSGSIAPSSGLDYSDFISTLPDFRQSPFAPNVCSVIGA